MHCAKCNIDFPEGLRYCKWCGEALADRPRVTSELHTCPSCAVAVKPGWAFCKACGERLDGSARESTKACPECGAELEPDSRHCPRCGQDLTAQDAKPEPQPSADIVVIASCPSCGEQVDAGTLYCKSCGSAVYTQEGSFGDASLLCNECNSYSPLGSSVCLVCNAPFRPASRTVVDRAAFPLQETNANKQAEAQAKPRQSYGHPSGAETIVLGEDELDDQPLTSPTKASVQTSVLPGTAGSKSEQQTAVVQMNRITSPVEEGETPHYEEASSGALELVTASDVEEAPRISSGIISESGGERESEAGTEIFVLPVAPSMPAHLDRISQDNVQTREVARPSPSVQETRVQQAWPAASHAAGDVQRVGVPPIQPGVTRQISSADSASLPFDQAPSQSLPRKRTGVVIASAAVVVIVITAAIFIAYSMLFSRGRASRPPGTQVTVEQPPVAAQPPAAPSKPATPTAPEGMLAIAAGSYTIGRNGADPLEQPQHKVDLPAFFLDRTEVTNAAYKKFVDATGHKPPSNWSGANFPSRHENYPVTGITWQDAVDFAAWAGKRLPSEDEWEAAARGTDGRIYPWGNEWRAGLANIGLKLEESADQYPAGLKEVGQYPQGASPSGAVDMIGNAWEWVTDEIALYSGNIEGKLTLKPGVTYRVIRGGAYDGTRAHDSTYRGYLDANQAYPKVGFRCAKDAK